MATTDLTTLTNHAAILPAPATPFVIQPTPLLHPGPNEILIRTRAVAINPVDVVLATSPKEKLPFPVECPVCLGFDVAGEVLEVGSQVTRFHPNDRILGMSLGFTGSRPLAEAGFQTYTILPAVVCSPIPSRLSFEEACVLPLGLSTAATGLFDQRTLALQLPKPSLAPKPTGQTILVWGAASSVGCNAVQLAVAAGYRVIATCSASNFALARSLGASAVFDYTNLDVVAQVVSELERERTEFMGCLDAIHRYGAFENCIEVVGRLQSGRKVVSTVVPMVDPALMAKVPAGVEIKTVFGSDLKDNEVGPAIFEHFLPHALEKGTYLCKPDAEVVGNGLEAAQLAIERFTKGVSAKKIVFSL